MIDTIKIASLIRQIPSPEELKLRGWWESFKEFTGKANGWSYKEKKAGSKYPYVHIFTAPDGISYLSVRISLPALIFGSNVHLPNQEQVEQSLDYLSEYVKEKTGFDFDAKTAVVWEVHFTRDYLVGEYMMRKVLSNLAEMSIPRFERGKYADTTLYFHSKGKGKEENKPRTICIYDKHKDCIDKSFPKDDIRTAEGMMRLEFRYKKPDAVKRLVRGLRLSNNEAQTILTQDISDYVLAPIQEQILLLLEETDVAGAHHKINEDIRQATHGNASSVSGQSILFWQGFLSNKIFRIFTNGILRLSKKLSRDWGSLHFRYD